MSSCSTQPTYSETFVQDIDDSGKFVHYRPLINGSGEPYLDYGKCTNKNGRCNTCYRYYKCDALVYGLTTVNGVEGLICYGGADPFNPSVDADASYHVSDFDNGGWLHVEVPAYEVYNGTTYPVLALAENAFKLDQIHTLKLNEGLISIGNQAFAYSSQLKEITIPNSVVHLGSSICYESSGIEKFVFGAYNYA